MDKNKTYLGDGVYVWFDGYQLWIETMREEGIHCIALESPVFDALIHYIKTMNFPYIP